MKHPIKLFRTQTAQVFQFGTFTLAAMLMCNGAHGLDLETAFASGMLHDSTFLTAESERNVNMAQAYAGWASYLPGFTWQQQQLNLDSATRQTGTISQPIFDMGALASVAQGSARKEFAKVTYEVKVQDLAQRTLQAVNQLILIREALSNNTSRINSYDQQYKAAKRKYDLGEGTITDVRDIEVRLSQTKVDDLNLKAQKRIAERKLEAITAQMPTDADFNLPVDYKVLPIPRLDEVIDNVVNSNPQIIASRQNQEISKYEVARASAQVLPTVSFTNVNSTYQGQTTINNGLTISIPFQIGGYINTYGAVEKYAQSKYQTTDAEVKARVEADRLHSMADAGYQMLQVRKNAIDAAKLSVDANQRSFTAGVRTSTEVLNSIQVLFQAKNDYVTTLTQQAETYLNLLLIQANEPMYSVKQVQSLMFLK